LAAYPALHVEDLANAWAYYSSHREDEDIDLQIRLLLKDEEIG